MHPDAAPNAGLEVELLQVIVTNSIVASVEVYEAIPKHSTVGITTIGEIGASAHKLPPDAGAEMKSEDVSISIDARAANNVHKVILHHCLVPIAPTRKLV